MLALYRAARRRRCDVRAALAAGLPAGRRRTATCWRARSATWWATRSRPCRRAGTLTVRTARRATAASRIEVEDTGPGLTDEQRTRLFTPYYTTKKGGTGLGLAIVQGIVSDHGGRVEVASAPGQGTTFTLLLPARRRRDRSRRMPKPRILIVDDDPGTLASLSRAFALEGYTALTASSAARGAGAAATRSRWTPSSPTW